jgi:hypothetical protein
MMRLNSGLAVGLVEFLKSRMAEGLYHLLSVTLRFAVVKSSTETRRNRYPRKRVAIPVLPLVY